MTREQDVNEVLSAVCDFIITVALDDNDADFLDMVFDDVVRMTEAALVARDILALGQVEGLALIMRIDPNLTVVEATELWNIAVRVYPEYVVKRFEKHAIRSMFDPSVHSRYNPDEMYHRRFGSFNFFDMPIGGVDFDDAGGIA